MPDQSWRNDTPYNHDLALMWRNARQAANMSLIDVKRAIGLIVPANGDEPYGLTVSYLSDFERGRLTPPLEDLTAMFHAIGYALQISITPLPLCNICDDAGQVGCPDCYGTGFITCKCKEGKS